VAAASDAIGNSSAAAVTLFLIALSNDRIGNGGDGGAKCGCSKKEEPQNTETATVLTRQNGFFNKWHSKNSLDRVRPFAPYSAQCEHSTSRFHLLPDHDLRLERSVTSKRMSKEAATRSFFSLYEVDFDNPLGSGAYGDVYLCRERATGEKYALKKIPKEYTLNAEFQREMNALLHIRAHGGHPNICMLKENFDEEDDYLLVFDLIDGGEMFYHLIQHGAYSEADASRLVRQVAAALDL
jgi:calcium-dependent protein kinase